MHKTIKSDERTEGSVMQREDPVEIKVNPDSEESKSKLNEGNNDHRCANSSMCSTIVDGCTNDRPMPVDQLSQTSSDLSATRINIDDPGGSSNMSLKGVCTKRFSSISGARGKEEEDTKEAHGRPLALWNCSECCENFPNWLALKLHRIDHDKTHKCRQCLKTFSRMQDFNKHKKICWTDWICGHCHRVFDRHAFLRLHMRRCHSSVLNSQAITDIEDWDRDYE